MIHRKPERKRTGVLSVPKQDFCFTPLIVTNAILHCGVRLTHRRHLANLCDALNLRTVVEVGVDLAVFASQLLGESSDINLIAVDPWLPYREIPYNRDEAEDTARQALAKFGNRVTVLKMKSVHASSVVQYADMVYIDGAHDEKSVQDDIDAWYPVVRSGGILAGHDFDHATVSRPVMKYAGKLRVPVYVINQTGDSRGKDEGGWWAHPSWFFYKL